jgi:adenylyltransferase/sulfurtransferase
MNEIDWKMLQARRSCALLSRDEMEEGKVPTVSTTASVIAGIQCQEAVKLIHGLDVLEGRGFVFEGMTHSSYVVAYTRKDDCPAHDMDEPVHTLPLSIAQTRTGDFLERVRSDLGGQAVIETSSDLLASLYCPHCNEEEPFLASLGKVGEREGRCPQCKEHRTPNLYHTIDGSEAFLDRALGDLGIPLWDVLAGRCGEQQVFYEFAGDRASVLGSIESD